MRIGVCGGCLYIVYNNNNKQGKKSINLITNVFLESFSDIRGTITFADCVNTVTNNYARIVVLGNKGAGKTSFVRKMFNSAETQNTDETTIGVEILNWKINDNKKVVDVSISDFASHVIIHEAYPCLLSERSLYIVVCDSRIDVESDLKYWLGQIKNYGGSSHTWVFINQKDNHKTQFSLKSITESFSFVQNITHFSIKDDTAVLENYRADISDYILNNDMFGDIIISSAYSNVKRALEKANQNGTDYIERKEFERIVYEESLGEISNNYDELLFLLHQIGVCFWYGRIKNVNSVILNPNWITTGIYKIINWVYNNPQQHHKASLRNYNDIFTYEKLRYPYEKMQFIFYLMENYELAFHISDDEILIPLSLQENQPENLPSLKEGSTQLKFISKASLPQNFFCRFIAMHYMDILNYDNVWRYGVVLKFGDETIVVITVDKNEIVAVIMGGKKEKYTEIVKKSIESIFESYKSRDVELVESNSFTIVVEESYEEIFTNFREVIGKANFKEAYSLLPKLNRVDEVRYSQLMNDLVFLFDTSKTLKENESNWEKHSVKCMATLWGVLTNKESATETKHKTEAKLIPNVQSDDFDKGNHDMPKKEKTSKYKKGKNSQNIGEKLEKNIMLIIQEIFSNKEKISTELEKLRKQLAGTQFGHDISFEYKDESGFQCICWIECKDTDIDIYQVTGKLEQARKSIHEVRIQHWIVISPNGMVKNDLDSMENSWNVEMRYSPIENIQIWSQDKNVEEFFAINSAIHEHYYKENKTVFPEKWSEEKRVEVIKKWKSKFMPSLPLPQAWKNYLLKHKNLLTFNEQDNQIIDAYNELYGRRIHIGCLDESRNSLGISAEKHIIEWAYKNSFETIFLLGDFGDGKTYLTYSIVRKLAGMFIKSPKNAVLPIRLTLKDLREGVNEQDFLRTRLESFDAKLGEWSEIRNSHRILVILDGFDEMSTGMDSKTLAKNINRLLKCVNSFRGAKLLITSRSTVFKSVKSRLLERITPYEVLYLAQIAPQDKIDFLRKYAEEHDAIENFNKLCATHDLLGLADKPIFLDMMKTIMLDGRIAEVDNLSLYSSYVEIIMDRKKDFEYERDDDEEAVNLQHTETIRQKLMEDFAMLCFKREESNESVGITFDDLENEISEYKNNPIAKTLFKHLVRKCY